jgi:uncharacterized protein (DUF2141 family)
MSSIIKETVPPKFEILITEAKSDKGMIRILIFPGENGFPDQPQKALKNYSIRPKNRACEVVLTDLPAGNYAVTVIHDEDEDGKLNTNPVGYPTEKFGFSNNPKIYFSAPSFEKTKVSFGTNDKKILITLN